MSDRPIRVVRGFDSFYQDEFRSVAGLAHVLTGDVSVGEDLAQEGFLAAYRRWDEIGGYEAPGAWVRKVVSNKAISRRRRLATERKYMPWLGGRDSTDLEVDTHGVIAAVGSLSARQAQAVALHYFSDLPLADVAQIMDCSIESVRTHLKRARARLAELLGESE